MHTILRTKDTKIPVAELSVSTGAPVEDDSVPISSPLVVIGAVGLTEPVEVNEFVLGSSVISMEIPSVLSSSARADMTNSEKPPDPLLALGSEGISTTTLPSIKRMMIAKILSSKDLSLMKASHKSELSNRSQNLETTSRMNSLI